MKHSLLAPIAITQLGINLFINFWMSVKKQIKYYGMYLMIFFKNNYVKKFFNLSKFYDPNVRHKK